MTNERVADGNGLVQLSVLWELFQAKKMLMLYGALLVGLMAYAVTYLIPPTYTGRASFLPPQAQNSSSAALASLGALAGLAGGGAGKTTADQYVSFMQSNRVLDELIDSYKLMSVYGVKYRVDARRELLGNAKITIGKKDGLISIAVDDDEPKRAADIANSFIDGLRRITNTFAISEAQQRRMFFQQQLELVKSKLVDAQVALQESGFTSGALKAEPKAAAETFARAKAELTSAEVRLQSMRGIFANTSPEIAQQMDIVTSLRAELSKVERKDQGRGGVEYIQKYREYKYQETLFDLFAKQYELARVDEGREGALIQVLDVATPPERKSRPMRALISGGSTLLFVIFFSIHLLFRAVVIGTGRNS